MCAWRDGLINSTIISLVAGVIRKPEAYAHRGDGSESMRGQVLINGSGFSAGGDSGSLIVTDNTSHNPVALLFAGSSTTTIANPIREVLTKLVRSWGAVKLLVLLVKTKRLKFIRLMAEYSVSRIKQLIMPIPCWSRADMS